MTPFYCASFIFEPGDLDDEFHRLDGSIKEIAEATEGFLGKETWIARDGKTFSSNYFWRDQSALEQFASHPKHLEAKRQYARWYKGYRVLISKVFKTYGDGGISDPVRNS